MSDLIDRQAAIDALNEVVKDHSITDFDAIASILDLPPAQPEQCDDAVSRTEVLRMIDCINDHQAITPYKSVGAVTEHLTRIARSLPHVTPKQRTGKWIKITKGAMREKYICSVCGRTIEEDGIEKLVPVKYPFCHCGAKMTEGDAE